MAKTLPTGYHHKWKYKNSLWEETKKRDKKGKTYWRVKWNAIKTKKSKSYGAYPKGFRGAWKLSGVQYIKKTGKGKYRTTFKGIKRPLKFYK